VQVSGLNYLGFSESTVRIPTSAHVQNLLENLNHICI
jgi:hypothetical protein